MNSDNLLITVAVIALFVSVIGAALTYNSLATFQNFITGHAFENGTVVLDVTSTASINITSANGSTGSKTLSWGSGVVSGSSTGHLWSNGTSTFWTGSNVSEGFIVENIGNVDVAVGISTNASAASFIGGSSPTFQYNLSNYTGGYCSGGAADALYHDFSSGQPDIACVNFSKASGLDKMRVDVGIRLPSDSKTGSLVNRVVLNYSAAA